MATFKRVVKLSVGGEDQGILTIEGDREKKTVSLQVGRSEGVEPLGKVTWVVDYEMKRLALDLSTLHLAMSGSCLLGCLVGAGASLADCIRKAKDEDEVWKCIDTHVAVMGAGVLGCVIACL